MVPTFVVVGFLWISMELIPKAGSSGINGWTILAGNERGFVAIVTNNVGFG